ncbi:MAG: uracil-DNA glycosylase [Pseudomonadota bacterium]|nr:uracil-DNA glycosylase [Pseudomonadota bacterium]
MPKLILPSVNCQKCKRLVEFRNENKKKFPEWHNAPVPSFGDINSKLLIVGLAPGLKGANRTGRPFTGDYAGDLLYPTLVKFGWASGTYNREINKDFSLNECRITNTVRCVPPQNKPHSKEQNSCLKFLKNEIENLPNLKYLLALGTIAHKAIIKCYNLKQKEFNFAHGKKHLIKENLTLLDSYHCSRYNVNTGRLTKEMFEEIFIILSR